jgi:hypothetical protein
VRQLARESISAQLSARVAHALDTETENLVLKQILAQKKVYCAMEGSEFQQLHALMVVVAEMPAMKSGKVPAYICENLVALLEMMVIGNRAILDSIQPATVLV